MRGVSQELVVPVADLSPMVTAAPLPAPSGDEALADALIAASSLMDPEAIAILAVAHVRTLCNTDAAALYWWDDSEHVLLPLSVNDGSSNRLHQVFHPGQGVTGEAFASGRPVIANGYPKGVRFPPAWTVAGAVHAVAAAPLEVNGKVSGVITVTQRRDTDLTGRDIELLELVGAQVAPMLHGMQALAHAQFRLTEARELASLIREAAMITDFAPLYDRICELSCRMLGADFAGVVLASDPERAWAADYGRISGAVSRAREPLDQGLLARLEQGAPFVLGHHAGTPAESLDAIPALAREGLRTVLAVPMTPPEDTLLGGLILGWRFDIDPTAQLVDLASTLGASATSLLTQAKTAAALRDGELLWRLTLSNAPVGICLLNLDGTFRLVNPAMARMVGYPEDELVTRDVRSVVHPDDAGASIAILDRARDSGGRSASAQIRCLHSDGHAVWTSSSAQVVCDDAGAPAYFSVQFEDVSMQRAQTAELLHLASHDSLTGLADRAQFCTLVDDRPSPGDEMIVALLDVPELRGLSDKAGQAIANQVVLELTRRLSALVDDAANDIAGVPECLARCASDEFAAILQPQPGRHVLEIVTERLVSAFAEPVVAGGRGHLLSVHIGVVSAPRNGDTAEELLRCADIALTAAHREHVSVREYTPALGNEEMRRQQLISDLRTDLAAGTLSMVFQPIIDAATDRLVAAEALARWTHATFGPIEPAAFVPLAEEFGLMPLLSAWALETAIAACARWQQDQPGVAVSVNLSASDLEDPSTAAKIAAALSRHDLPPSLLEVELTETTVMRDADAALATLKALATLGVGLAIDDFGTGFSSLSYLKGLPVTSLKIDRSFTAAISSDRDSFRIVEVIIQLARLFDLLTTAEGVEDAATRDLLAAIGCDRLQGYGIARPMAAGALAQWKA
ncbi:MAG: EAL domain-containing protein [Acidimicrobiales bacterium]